MPILAMLMAIPAAALAQGEPSGAPQRIRSVTILRGQPCPPAVGDEVVVCTTIIEPYRIPSALRRSEPSASNQSWVNRTATMDRIGRAAGGLPDTCSPVGTGGQSGCALSWNNAYAAQRRADANAAASVPGGEE
jgi:hypothetical protein